MSGNKEQNETIIVVVGDTVVVLKGETEVCTKIRGMVSESVFNAANGIKSKKVEVKDVTGTEGKD